MRFSIFVEGQKETSDVCAENYAELNAPITVNGYLSNATFGCVCQNKFHVQSTLAYQFFPVENYNWKWWPNSQFSPNWSTLLKVRRQFVHFRHPHLAIWCTAVWVYCKICQHQKRPYSSIFQCFSIFFFEAKPLCKRKRSNLRLNLFRSISERATLEWSTWIVHFGNTRCTRHPNKCRSTCLGTTHFWLESAYARHSIDKI